METQDNKEQITANESVEVKNAAASAEGSHFDHIKETLEILYKTFPAVFVKEGEVKPLKIGIFEELKSKIASVEGLSLSKVRAALRIYTSRLKYLYSVKEGAARIDAEGKESDDKVSAEHEAFAKEKIKEILAKRKANAPKKPAPVKKTFLKRTSNKPNAKVGKKPPVKIVGEKATAENLKEGVNVLVLTSDQRSVRGVVAQDAQKDSVYVTLKSGLTVNLPIDRVLIDKK